MAETRRRHLAAILFTDLTGYTALLGDDEEAGRRVRERHRATLEKAIGDHAGTIVNRMGDGALTVFPTATDAVAAAIEIQQSLQDYPRIPLRIGIHLGEVAYDEEGAYGDAVNVASRINAIATPGSVLVSEAIRSQLENQPRFAAVELGEVRLKNVRRPARIYAIAGDHLIVPTLEELTARVERAGPIARERAGSVEDSVPDGAPSIAVLPFTNMSADPENEYFCDGLAEDLITALSKLEGLRVAARTSAFFFKGRKADIREIGRTLAVTTVLEGGVRKSGQRLRITTQLIETRDGYHIWSERYDREMRDLFDVQDEIVLEVVDALKVRLLEPERKAALKRHTRSTEAHQLYLKGRFHWLKASPDGVMMSRQYFERAVELDPGFALGYSGLADFFGYAAVTGLLAPAEGWRRAEIAIQRALQLDPDLAEAHNSQAALRMFCYRDGAGAERELERAIELDPRQPEFRLLRSVLLVATGRLEQAIAEAERALEIDPLSARNRFTLGWWLYLSGLIDNAIEQFRQAIELDPVNPVVHEFLGDALEQKGLLEEAFREWSRSFSLMGDTELVQTIADGFSRGGFEEAVRAVARKRIERLDARRAQGEHVPPIEYARAHTRLGDNEQALRWLEEATREPSLYRLIMGLYPLYDRLREEPRFQEIVERGRLRMAPVGARQGVDARGG